MSIKKFFRLLWKEQCAGCGAAQALNGCGFCPACVRNVVEVENPAGADVLHIFRYEGPVKESIRRFKYSGKKYYGGRFALLASDFIRKNVREDFDAVVPVPLHWKKEFKRGFNQSAIVASRMAGILNKKYLPGVLVKRKNTSSQTELSVEERKKNVRGAFRARRAHLIKGGKFLLVDDVYTSGATVREAKKTLLAGGAEKVIILTLAKA
ncbi:MAG: ComF family protein [Candidatus Omnitrophica bacterium]|nr:ComF family protein [Candidatus Omnitrophota bacterium]